MISSEKTVAFISLMAVLESTGATVAISTTATTTVTEAARTIATYMARRAISIVIAVRINKHIAILIITAADAGMTLTVVARIQSSRTNSEGHGTGIAIYVAAAVTSTA